MASFQSDFLVSNVSDIAEHKSPRLMKFIENKQLDMALVGVLLEECRAVNQWANFGPLYHRLADEYAQHMSLAPDLVLTPCANAGVGLELLARGAAQERGVPKLRWVGSAFSFKNLGRGYFADMHLLDCDAGGMLDLAALEALPADSFDGFVVTNPLGMRRDFERYVAFAKASGKQMLIDNAAGMDRVIPDWPWQVFSLHHTKPYGMGEGGLVLSPKDSQEALIYLMNYDKTPDDPAHWINNGKISDLACAFHIARLRGVDQWENAYRDQRARITALFASCDIYPLIDAENAPLTNSLAVLFPGPFNRKNHAAKIATARQYEPLALRPQAQEIYDRIVNFPTHPDMTQLTDGNILAEIEQLLICTTTPGKQVRA